MQNRKLDLTGRTEMLVHEGVKCYSEMPMMIYNDTYLHCLIDK